MLGASMMLVKMFRTTRPPLRGDGRHAVDLAAQGVDPEIPEVLEVLDKSRSVADLGDDFLPLLLAIPMLSAISLGTLLIHSFCSSVWSASSSFTVTCPSALRPGPILRLSLDTCSRRRGQAIE